MKRLRIFIADDESIIRIDLREMLSEMGHEVVGEATTGKEALWKIMELDPDLVFLDIKAYIVKPFRSAVLEPAIQLALAYFNELKILQEENATLKETLELSKLINKAKGLLMEHEKLSEQEAFRKIQKLSMDRNKKMREVAEAVILVYEKTTIQNRPS
jgi:AmiR/NasT family two-component response regulator